MKRKQGIFFYSILIDCIAMIIALLITSVKLVNFIKYSSIETDNLIICGLVILIAIFSVVWESLYFVNYFKGRSKNHIESIVGFCFCIQAVVLAAILIIIYF